MNWILFQLLNKLGTLLFKKSTITKIVNELEFDGALNSDNLITVARLNIECAARTGKKTAVVFEFLGANISFQNITLENVSGPPKDVYNYCLANGFKPKFEFIHDKEQNHCFKIVVPLPIAA